MLNSLRGSVAVGHFLHSMMCTWRAQAETAVMEAPCLGAPSPVLNHVASGWFEMMEHCMDPEHARESQGWLGQTKGSKAMVARVRRCARGAPAIKRTLRCIKDLHSEGEALRGIVRV